MAICPVQYGIGCLLTIVVDACSLGWVRGHAIKAGLFENEACGGNRRLAVSLYLA